jgi:galactokinase
VIVRATAPGRVNLIGDHTDHTGGLVLPMAIDLATTVTGEASATAAIELTSATEPAVATVALPVRDATSAEPPWARYVAGVAAELDRREGFRGSVETTIPVGAGLSSSAALLVAVALALGADPSDRLALALLCQRAEQRAAGVPCGVMDHLASVAGRAGHALLIDTTTLDVEEVPVPPDAEIVVVHSGEDRQLAGSPYAERRARCEAAQSVVGPLRTAEPAAVEAIVDPVIRAAGRHVVTENARVRAAAGALRRDDLVELGRLMVESHASLRDDLEVSTPALDALVERLLRTPGVHGARLTGAGFGGCVVALTDPGALSEGWVVRAADGARVSPAR